eukprot:COSAG01_NODE_4087_length_5365_cov_5.981200_4_plen_108_part_00
MLLLPAPSLAHQAVRGACRFVGRNAGTSTSLPTATTPAPRSCGQRGCPPPPPDEQARLLGIELLLEAEEAAQFFGELAAHKEAATCELPQLPGVLWSTDMRLASERE